ncbi:MAG: rhomboid family intramembrane serine protease [Alphaproteobacteria bacterium]|nr:rhomboid family intramembrane serine protease [Alphaproteobacteria bacterium]
MDEYPWVELRRFDAASAAEEHALVLAAMGIAHRLVGREGTIGLEVWAAAADQAGYELAAYREENQPRPEPAAPALATGIDGAVLYGAIGLFLYAGSTAGWFSPDWLTPGSAQVGFILQGEWWRVFTALGLHADPGHLIANLIMGGILAVLLAERLGSGLAWFAILLAGGAGNALNAWAQTANHTTIGASTGVFAALGLLAAQSWTHDRAPDVRGLRRFLPLAGGVILLSFLGVGGERTDVGAHVFGFAVGVVLGAGLFAAERHVPRRGLANYGFGAAALALFTFAWLKAFHVV